nr:exodeoxyribonuclease VII small subunit [Lachnospiraceae bacterium]
MNEEITIEETFDQLEEVLKRMEDKGISLEERFVCYERGMKR